MSIYKDLYVAIGKSILGRYAVYFFNILSLMLLARLFSPEVFGIVAAVSVIYTFFQLMAEAGIVPAIINLPALSNSDRNGLFGLTGVLGAGLGLVFYYSAPLLTILYSITRVDEVVPYIAISIFIYGLSMVPTAFLLRDQEYFRIANAGVLAEMVSTASVFFLNGCVDPLYALAAKTCISATTNFCCVYTFSGKTEFGRPKFGVNFYAIRPLLSFSSYQFGFNIINYFSRNLDNILVGRYMGADYLGVYDKAYQLMRYPLMLLTFAMTPAIQPSLRRHAGDKVVLEELHRSFLFKLSLVGSAVALAVFFLAETIVQIVLGSQWVEVVPVIKILSIAIPAQVVMSTSGSFFQAINRPDLLLYSGFLLAVTMISAMIYGVSQHSLIVLSWALVIAFNLNFFVIYLVLYRYGFLLSMLRFLVGCIPMFMASLIMAIIYLAGR